MHLIRHIIIYCLPVILASCCFGNRKCKQDNNAARFRILDKGSGKDLVFGPARRYDPAFIRFYSVSGADTIIHNYGPGPSPNPGEDSLLYVDFDFRKPETVFLSLTGADTDTLLIRFEIIDPAPCCVNYTVAKPGFLNNQPLTQLSGGITVLYK